MGPKSTLCGVCKTAQSKYRCPSCPVRYCSVACFKMHKAECTAAGGDAPAPHVGPSTNVQEGTENVTTAEGKHATAETNEGERELKPLTSLRWPPEPDRAIFMDPLKRDDAKPLRHEELERIATSKPLRDLLATTALPRVLLALDALPVHQRHSSLARILGVDTASLTKPATSAFLRDGSPPPLQDLLAAAAGGGAGGAGAAGLAGGRDDAEGWYLGHGEGRVWIGEEERRLVRLWAGVVVRAIDEKGEGDWGQGALTWEIPG